MTIVAWIVLGLGAGLLASKQIPGSARRHRDSHRSYDSERPALVRAEKRLYQDPGRPLLVDERRVDQGNSLL